jgi:hypothetical protein
VATFDETIAETLSIAPASPVGWTAVLSDGLNVTQLMEVVKAHDGTISENLTLADALTPLLGVVLAERIAIDLADIANHKFTMSIAEQAIFYSELVAALPVTISENLTIAAAEIVTQAVTVIEALGLEEVLTPAVMYRMSIAERLTVADAITRFMGADIIDGITVSPAMSLDVYRTAQVDETLELADALSPQFVLRVSCEETLELTADEALNMIFSAEVDEAIELAGAYLAPNGSITTWVMNTRTAGVTEYQNYAFNSFARVGNVYLGASENGLYELLGDDDDGTDIIATIRSGFAQWAGTHLGSFKGAYLAVAGAGDYILRVLTRDGKTYNYRVTAATGKTVKVNMGKGLRSRYFAFELVSTGQDFDLDTLEFIPLIADRRV